MRQSVIRIREKEGRGSMAGLSVYDVNGREALGYRGLQREVQRTLLRLVRVSHLKEGQKRRGLYGFAKT